MSFRRYEAYKDSGVEWLAAIPSHWIVSRLGFESWVRARLGWKGLKAEEYVDEGFIFLSTPNIKGRDIDFVEVNFINRERFDESPEIQLREGDVLLAKDGSTLGTVNVVRHLPRPTTVNSSIAVITPHEGLTGTFLYYLFASTYMKNTIQRTKGGMGVPHLFQADLNKFYLPLPPLSEQDDIAEFLDRKTAQIDILVTEQQRLIELLTEKRQAVISHAVTKGLNPDAPMKPSGIEWLGDVPSHWLLVRFESAIAVQEGPGIMAVDFLDAGVPLLRVSGVQSRWATLEGCNYLDPVKVVARWNHFRLALGDLLITASASMGSVSEVGQDAVGAVPYTGLIRLAAKSDVISKNFIRAILASDLFMTQIELLKTGATIQHFGPSHLHQMKVPLPPRYEQEQICAHIAQQTNSLDTLIAQSGRAIDLLQERRTALISAAVTGQIDVRGLAQVEVA